jgi:Asp-tRNA(Asn)/Glu-tRNA(Gln) amidotransferase A subunit family amidase
MLSSAPPPAPTADALARLRAADASLHAFAALLDDEAATRQARELPAGPLAGQWVAVKDIFDTAGLPTAYGSPIYAGHRPAMDAALVGVVRRAGGLVIGKSVTTEFAFLQPAATHNPAAPGCTPGGSSAGSAAAVAAGLVPFAIGSQTGGSTVRPASYCGIAGFKPTFGMLPTAGMKPFSWSLDTVGLFARTVEDVAVFAQAVSGGRIAAPVAHAQRPWTFGVPASYPWGAMSASAAKALERGVAALRAAGARVVECTLPPWAGDAFHAHDAVQGWEAVRALRREMDERGSQLSPLLRDYLAGALKVTDAHYATAQAAAAVARARCDEWLEGIDVLLTPGAPDEPPEGYASTGASTFNRAWTLLATPCLNVPGATGVNGRPMGLQVIAPRAMDDRCLAAGAFLARALAA